jgi:imidazolonepropionase-like amidohydrolase
MITVLENANVLDPDEAVLIPDRHVVIEAGRIADVAHAPVRASEARRIDLSGLTLMPGLIDCHVHAIAYTANLAELPRQSPFYVAARAAGILAGMLDRGFTTVRDVGGGEYGLARAVAEGAIRGPRVLYGGKALSPTAGHGDMRAMGQDAEDVAYAVPSLARRCDGVAEVRRVARDEIRRGAHHIKIMANGGIASPTDRITSDQFSEDEIRAAVDEAAMAGLYVVAHAYTARSVARAVRCGVRSIEHGNLLDEPTVLLMKERGAFLVPTLVTYRALSEEGVAAGLPQALVGKIGDVLEAGIRAVETAQRAGVPMAYGTDLLGAMQRRQLDEFMLRSEVVPAADLVRSVTTNAARLVGLENEIGRVAPGYRADLIAVDGDPLRDIRVLTEPETRLKLVMKEGVAHRSEPAVM